jgi:hypothetical protein
MSHPRAEEDGGLLRSQSEQHFGKPSSSSKGRSSPAGKKHAPPPPGSNPSPATNENPALSRSASNLNVILPTITDVAGATLAPLSFLEKNTMRNDPGSRAQSPAFGGRASAGSPFSGQSLRKPSTRMLRPSRSILFGMESRDGAGMDADGKPLKFFDDHLVRTVPHAQTVGIF